MTNFKKATEKDIPLIRELATISWSAAYENILSTAQIDYMLSEMYSSETILTQIKNSNYLYYLIIKEGKAVGFIGFEFHYEEKTTKLHRIYLVPEAKGKSLGKEAMKFLKREVTSNEDNRIILNVNKDNSAKSFYESQGFQVYEEAVFDIGNGFVMDDYLMEFTFDL
ncbi:GNAT family N-acetyltransferase [Kaistella gelatinilytica]|uniref:GNAT family N-acetyltransferase n=1 Tax=Kaistella gelatinilytica TaxID=2787636 RepID=UPI00293D46E9|nr:GNAT family N-acetyltransferase [Kaistella gelatinilytica]